MSSYFFSKKQINLFILASFLLPSLCFAQNPEDKIIHSEPTYSHELPYSDQENYHYSHSQDNAYTTNHTNNSSTSVGSGFYFNWTGPDGSSLSTGTSFQMQSNSNNEQKMSKSQILTDEPSQTSPDKSETTPSIENGSYKTLSNY